MQMVSTEIPIPIAIAIPNPMVVIHGMALLLY